MKIFFIFLVFICFSQIAFAQKKFQITIKLDSSISAPKVRYQYDDGKTTIYATPDGGNKKNEIILKGRYFSAFLSFEISYIGPNNEFYVSDFFIGNKPAVINFYFKPNPDQLLPYRYAKNAWAIYDTITNKIYHELIIYNRKQNLAVYNFTQKNNNQQLVNDSLKKIYMSMLRSVDMRSMQFLKKHADDYFSFWFFKKNIAIASLYNPKTDTTYLKQQLTYLESTFPKKYTQSVEGRNIIESYKLAIHPLKVDDKSPSFTIKTIDSKILSLSNLKGKYVLLDFWATWCPPCIEEIPFIKELRNNYSPDKLEIIGISRDQNINKLTEVIKEQSMNWDHFFDKETEISRLYKVNNFPTLILLNKEGKIIYKSDYIKNDKDALPKLLNTLN